MALGGFERDDLQAPMAEINTTPLVDVMLVLMVIFLVTAPMLTQSIKLELPNEAATQIKEQKAIVLSIDSGQSYFWDDTPVAAEALEQRFQSVAAENAEQSIYLRADVSVPYGKVSHVLALAQAAGLSNVGLITEPK